MSTRAHSKIGASSAHRWMACPGSVRQCENVENKSSFYAAEGTAAHKLAEDCYRKRVSVFDSIGMPWEASGFSGVITEEMADAVYVYLVAICDIEAGSGHDGEVEVRFHLAELHDGLFGTCDFAHFDPADKVLTVLDYKHGAGVAVEVQDNPQLLYYALGAALRMKDRGARRVRVGICQPRCPHPDGATRWMEIDAIDLLDFATDLLAYVKATEAPDAPLVPGSHCKWCPGAATCPGLRDGVNAAAAAAFGGSDRPGAGTDAKARVAAMTPQQLAEALANADIIEAWIGAVREHAYQEAEAGRAPTGWKLVDKRPTRRWRDEQATASVLMPWLGDEVFAERKLRSPAQIEKLIAKDKYALLDPLVTKESSGHTLVRDDDKRPAAKPAPSDVFSVVGA